MSAADPYRSPPAKPWSSTGEPLRRGASRTARARRARRAGWALSVVAVLLGVLAAAAAFVVGATPEDRRPRPLPVDAAWTVPERVPFVGDMVVYGTPVDGGRPGLEELGCQVTTGGGPLSTVAAASEDRVVVDGRGLVPLVSFPGRPGHSVACTGAAAAAAAPLYVVPGSSDRSLVPLAGWTTSVLLVPVGVLGLLMLGASMPERRR